MNTSRWATASPANTSATTVTPSIPPQAPVEVSEPASETTIYDSYEPQDISTDEFAQTRPPDDLFDDDFTPYEESAPFETSMETAVVNSAESTPENPTISQSVAPPPQAPARGVRGAPRGPRRGADTSRHGAHQSRHAASTTGQATAAENAKVENGASTKQEPRETAVRGDRSGTGGPKHKKLSEDELSAKLEAMKLKNASLMEKHARSQADEELFNQREAVAAQKRKEERVNRQQMMGEREKNRLRKLKAQGGREWDVEKDESSFTDNARGSRRGAHGAIAGGRPEAAPGIDTHDERHHSDARGRGGRARGRGGRANQSNQPRGTQPSTVNASTAQSPPSASDFPDLPEAKKSDNDVQPAKTLEFPIKTKQALEKSMTDLVGGEKTSWADQVEQST